VTGTTNQRSKTGIKDESLCEISNKLTQIKQKDFLKDLIVFDVFLSAGHLNKKYISVHFGFAQRPAQRINRFARNQTNQYKSNRRIF